MFIVKGKSGKVIGRYPTRAAAARRIAQLKAGAQRLAPYKFGSARSPVAGGFDSLEVVPSQHGGYVLRYPNGTFWTPSGPLSWPPSMWNGPTSGRWTSLEGAKRALDNIRRGKKPESDEPGVKQKKGRLAHSPYRTGGRRPRPLSRIGQMIEREQDRRHDAYLRTEEGERARMRGNEERLARMRARKSGSPRTYAPPGVVKLRRFNRAQLIEALNLSPEGRGRGQKYDFTTDEFRKRIAYGIGPKERRARELLLGAA